MADEFVRVTIDQLDSESFARVAAIAKKFGAVNKSHVLRFVVEQFLAGRSIRDHAEFADATQDST